MAFLIDDIIVALVLMVASTVASNVLARATRKKQSLAASDTGRGHLVNTCTTDANLRLCYGICRVGINEIYKGVTGDDNQYLHIVGGLGEGPIAGIVRADGSFFTSTATEFPADNPPLLYLDGTLWTEEKADLVYAEFFDGSSTQSVCSTLAAAVPEWTDCMRHTAYVYVRLKYDPDRWVSLPDITVTVAGLKLFDPIGYGIAHDDNNALVMYDMLTRPSTRGGLGLEIWHPGAFYYEGDRIDRTSIGDLYDYCATKGWAFNAPIAEDDYFADNMELVLACCRGEIIYSETKFKFRFRDLNYETPVMDLTADDVISNDDGSSSIEIEPAVDAFDLPNTIKATFYNEAINFMEDDYSHTDPEALAADGDLRCQDVALWGLKDREKVQAMVNYLLERARWGHQVTGSYRDRCMSLEPIDLVTLTHGTPGYDGQVLRVLGPDIDPATQRVSLTLIEEDASLYDDTYAPSEQQRYLSSQWRPTDQPPSVSGLTLTEQIYYYRGQSYTRLLVAWDSPAAAVYPWWDYAEVYVKIDDGDWRYMTRSEGDYMIDPAAEGAEYWVRVRSVNVYGVKEPLASASMASRSVQGKTAAPGDLAALTAVASGDAVTLYAAAVTDPDIEGYETRLGDSWASGVFVSFDAAPSVRLIGVRPGTHTFWMSAQGTNGVYSATPVSATVTVFVPPGYSSADSWTWDYDAIGTHDNTEHTTRNSTDAVKCSHTAGVLSGTWTSPSYDLGSIQKVRVWGDFLSDFSSGATTFDGVFSTTLKFSDVDAAGTMTFQEILQPTAAAQITATLYYSEDGSNWDEVDYFQVMAADVEARYVRVSVTITDPTPDSNLYLYELNMSAYSGPA